MKKIFTLFFISLLVAGHTNAQSLVANNVIYTTYGSAADLLLQTQFEVMNTSSNSMDVLLHRYDINVVPGSTNNFCWGPNCYGPGTYLSPQASTIAAGATDITFRGDYSPNGFPGVSTVAYCFFDANNPSDSVCVQLNYDASQTGVNWLNKADNY